MEKDDVEPLLQLLEDRAARHAGDSSREARDLKTAMKKINLKSSSQVVKMAAAGERPVRVFTVAEALQSGASDEDKKRFLAVQNRLIDGCTVRCVAPTLQRYRPSNACETRSPTFPTCSTQSSFHTSDCARKTQRIACRLSYLSARQASGKRSSHPHSHRPWRRRFYVWTWPANRTTPP